MGVIIRYTRTEYVADLLLGRSDRQATERSVKRVTELTGLDPLFGALFGGRLETQAYLREVYRAEGKLGSRYDSNVTGWYLFQFDPQQRTNDPILDSIIAPTTTAMVDFITHTVGWKGGALQCAELRCQTSWTDKDNEDHDRVERGSVEELRQSVAVDPREVLIVHGWGDIVSVHGFRAHRRSDAGHGQCEPRSGEGIPGRAHVLQPERQSAGAAQGRDEDVRGKLSPVPCGVLPTGEAAPFRRPTGANLRSLSKHARSSAVSNKSPSA